MGRLARIALALFLVPIAVFGASSSASAVVGPWRNATVVAANPINGALDITCQLTLRQSGVAEIPGIQVGSNGYCVGGPDITPGQAQGGEAGAAYMLSVDGLTAAGVPCNGSLAGVLGPYPANGTVRVAGAVSAGFINIAAPCSIQRVGIRFDGTNMDQFTWQGVDIPATSATEPPAANGCVHGTPTFTYKWVKVGENMAGYYKWDLVLTLNVSINGVSTAQWAASVQGNYGRGANILLSARETVFKHIEWEGVPWGRPIGVEVFAYPDSWNSGGWEDPNAQIIGSALPATQSDPYAGWTQPSHCRFYFGAPIVNDGNAATTEDVPFGDGSSEALPPPPEEPEPTVVQPEPVTDPPVDLGWLALIWGVLRSILGIISSLANSIVDGIKDGLRALFLPDQDNWGVEELVDQLKDKPPFSLFAELEDESRSMGLAYRAGGSCGVIADFGNGGVLNCAAIANVPGYSALYALVSAGLMGLTGWGLFLMVSRTFEQGQ